MEWRQNSIVWMMRRHTYRRTKFISWFFLEWKWNTGAEPCEAGKFQCKSDKTCIDIGFRCDGKTDCNDRSDEIGCRELLTWLFWCSFKILSDQSDVIRCATGWRRQNILHRPIDSSLKFRSRSANHSGGHLDTDTIDYFSVDQNIIFRSSSNGCRRSKLRIDVFLPLRKKSNPFPSNRSGGRIPVPSWYFILFTCGFDFVYF